MSVRVTKDVFDPVRGLRTVTLTDDHGRVHDVMLGVLASSPLYHPNQQGYIDSVKAQFAADEQAIADFMTQNPNVTPE